MSAIGSGDWVECIGCDDRKTVVVPRKSVTIKGLGYPQRGMLYQVREARVYHTPEGPDDGLRLFGIVASISGHPDAWWSARGFRPIYRPKADLLASLMQPAPELERV